MRVRRRDDRTLGVLMATPTRWIADGTRAPSGDERTPRFTMPSEPAMMPLPCGDEQDLVLLLESGPEEGVLLTAAGTCRLSRAAEGDLLAQTRARVAELRQERMRQAKRQRLPDQLIAYFEELNAAETEDDVYRALAGHALRIVGAHTSLALVHDRARGLLRAPPHPGGPHEYRACILWDPRFAQPGVLLALDTRGDGACHAAAPLFGDPATAQLAHVPVADEGLLVLTERREDRVFEPEDWDVLRALALQAEMALRRIRLIENVRSLSLTDSLTGLANRRHMDVMMEHAWSAARRGEPLAVMVLDLDGFKAVNDAQGHQAGDRVLCEVADVLRSEARGSDVVVRFGGDEFLAILPGGNAAAAQALADRVGARLGAKVGVSAGIAVYRPELSTPDDLVREADRALYEAKRARGGR